MQPDHAVLVLKNTLESGWPASTFGRRKIKPCVFAKRYFPVLDLEGVGSNQGTGSKRICIHTYLFFDEKPTLRFEELRLNLLKNIRPWM